MSIEKITKIVLTGGIASGKTYVSNYLHNTGIPIIDLDDISKEITHSNTHNIISIFGEQITTNKQFDTTKLKTLVFDNADKMQQLEEFLHPKILSEMQTRITKFATLGLDKVIIVVPLLIEKKLYHYFDRAIVVLTTAEMQQQRMMKRDNIDKKLAENILNTQATNAQRKNITAHLPTQFITNNSSIQELEEQIHNLHL